MARRDKAPIIVREFGGLNLAAPEAAVSIGDCVDCLNVHTANGAIEVRPGYQIAHTNEHASSPIFTVLKVVHLDEAEDYTQATYIVCFAEGPENRVWIRVYDPEQTTPRLPLFVDATASVWRASIIAMHRRIYCIYGKPSDSRKIYKRGVSWYAARIGIVAPENAPIVSQLGPPGALDGTFSYRYTYYNETADVESGPSPAVEEEASPLYPAIAIEVAPSSDGQVTHTRLYRREQGLDVTWYYYATRPYDELEYIDHGWSEEDKQRELNLVTNIPPSSRCVAVYKRRMWWVPSNNENRVRYSELDRPEQVDPRVSISVGGRGDPIRGMRAAFGRLLIFKRYSLWQITGSGSSTFVPTMIDSRAGCETEHSIVDVGNAICYLGRNGVYRLAGGMPQNISRNRIPRLDEIFSAESLDGVSAAHDPARHLYIVTGRHDGVYRQLVYDYVRDNWSIWNLPFSTIELMRTENDARILGNIAPRDPVLEEIGCVTGQADIDQPIGWSWKMPRSDFGTLGHKKFYYLGAAVEGRHADVKHEGELIGEIGPGQPMARIGSTAQKAQFEFSEATSIGTTMAAMEIAAELVGQR